MQGPAARQRLSGTTASEWIAQGPRRAGHAMQRAAPLSGTAGGAILLCLPRSSTRKDGCRRQGAAWGASREEPRTPRSARRDPGGQSRRNPLPGRPNRPASRTDPAHAPGRARRVPDSAITTGPPTNGSRGRRASHWRSLDSDSHTSGSPRRSGATRAARCCAPVSTQASGGLIAGLRLPAGPLETPQDAPGSAGGVVPAPSRLCFRAAALLPSQFRARSPRSR